MGTDNVHIASIDKMITPEDLKEIVPSSEKIEEHVEASRKIISEIVHGKDNRLMVIVGPCSIHNPEAGLDYAKRLVKLKSEFPHLFIVMRTYFEKPRTTVGWKGLINDPHLDGSFDINKGIQIARKFIMDVNDIGLPAATEFLDNFTPADIADGVSWGAIGARTTESQTHREMSSGLSMPIGYKNSTNGDTQIAYDAINSSKNPHNFLGINNKGERVILRTTGNPDGHIILRGGKGIRNYDKVAISETTTELENAGIDTGIVVDFSHANSNKKHNLQPQVCSDIANQIASGNKKIVGVMIESNINAKNQSFNPETDDVNNLKYGVSITDECSPFDETEKMLNELNIAVGLRNAV